VEPISPLSSLPCRLASEQQFGKSTGFMPGHASASQHEILEEPEQGVTT